MQDKARQGWGEQGVAVRGRTGQGVQGVAGQGRAGQAGQVNVRNVKVRQGYEGKAGQGKSKPSKARQVMTRQDKARHF
jgi:hypothetical protein